MANEGEGKGWNEEGDRVLAGERSRAIDVILQASDAIEDDADADEKRTQRLLHKVLEKQNSTTK
jgi:hypothetical protein